MKEKEFESDWYYEFAPVTHSLVRLRKKLILEEVKSAGKQTKLNTFFKVEEDSLTYRIREILEYDKAFPIGNSEAPELAKEPIKRVLDFDSKEEALRNFEGMKAMVNFLIKNKVANGRRYLWGFEIEDGKAHLVSKNTAWDGKLIELSRMEKSKG